MEKPNQNAGRTRDVIKIAGLVVAVLLMLQIYSEMLCLYDTVLEQGRTIEMLLQTENNRLARELERQTMEASPAEAVGVSYPQIAVFTPLDIPLADEVQRTVWSLCGEYPTFLSQQEFFELVLKVMWNESNLQMDIPDNCNTNGTIDLTCYVADSRFDVVLHLVDV